MNTNILKIIRFTVAGSLFLGVGIAHADSSHASVLSEAAALQKTYLTPAQATSEPAMPVPEALFAPVDDAMPVVCDRLLEAGLSLQDPANAAQGIAVQYLRPPFTDNGKPRHLPKPLTGGIAPCKKFRIAHERIPPQHLVAWVIKPQGVKPILVSAEHRPAGNACQVALLVGHAAETGIENTVGRTLTCDDWAGQDVAALGDIIVGAVALRIKDTLAVKNATPRASTSTVRSIRVTGPAREDVHSVRQRAMEDLMHENIARDFSRPLKDVCIAGIQLDRFGDVVHYSIECNNEDDAVIVQSAIEQTDQHMKTHAVKQGVSSMQLTWFPDNS